MSTLFFTKTYISSCPITSGLPCSFLGTLWPGTRRGSCSLLVEAAGIEPASKEEDSRKPTCLVSILISGDRTPTDRFSITPAYEGSSFLIGVRKDYPASMTPCRAQSRKRARMTWLLYAASAYSCESAVMFSSTCWRVSRNPGMPP
ncbi:MAG: hypothetical protein A4E62_03054 [Syntrophorhabdus sp. PtaU1.Bin002]|nr:MAG: hypothetical protein A4E62_03054 [Syntrophorhabdus sp. PtaU1.Bin002]